MLTSVPIKVLFCKCVHKCESVSASLSYHFEKKNVSLQVCPQVFHVGD